MFVSLFQTVNKNIVFSGSSNWWGLQPGDRRHLRLQLQGRCARAFWFHPRQPEENHSPHSQHRHPLRSVLTHSALYKERMRSKMHRSALVRLCISKISLLAYVNFAVQVGMWSRAAQTDSSPTCSSLSPLPRNQRPCSEDAITSSEAASCHLAWRGSTSSTCLSTPARTVCYNCRGFNNTDPAEGLDEDINKTLMPVLLVWS